MQSEQFGLFARRPQRPCDVTQAPGPPESPAISFVPRGPSRDPRRRTIRPMSGKYRAVALTTADACHDSNRPVGSSAACATISSDDCSHSSRNTLESCTVKPWAAVSRTSVGALAADWSMVSSSRPRPVSKRAIEPPKTLRVRARSKSVIALRSARVLRQRRGRPQQILELTVRHLEQLAVVFFFFFVQFAVSSASSASVARRLVFGLVVFDVEEPAGIFNRRQPGDRHAPRLDPQQPRLAAGGP